VGVHTSRHGRPWVLGSGDRILVVRGGSWSYTGAVIRRRVRFPATVATLVRSLLFCSACVCCAQQYAVARLAGCDGGVGLGCGYRGRRRAVTRRGRKLQLGHTPIVGAAWSMCRVDQRSQLILEYWHTMTSGTSSDGRLSHVARRHRTVNGHGAHKSPFDQDTSDTWHRTCAALFN